MWFPWGNGHRGGTDHKGLRDLDLRADSGAASPLPFCASRHQSIVRLYWEPYGRTSAENWLGGGDPFRVSLTMKFFSELVEGERLPVAQQFQQGVIQMLFRSRTCIFELLDICEQ